MSVHERNEKAKQYVNSKIVCAKSQKLVDFSDLQDLPKLSRTLDDLIDVKPHGFRGVVLTAIVGMELNPSFDPLNHFYSCNPRSIFEKGIWYALTENQVPCGKSDPLNVAKNVNELNESWADGRRPQKAATAAVSYLRLICAEKDVDRRSRLIDYFFFRLWAFAESIQGIEVVSVDLDRRSTTWLGKRLADFVLKFPESGTTPQLVVGHLIAAIYESSNVTVEGYKESVFGTNTTSKKPADIWLSEDGSETVLYEVTVKVVDPKRLDDCLDSLSKMNLLEKPVRFICRIPQDVLQLDIDENNEFVYKGKTFEFVDIQTFIESCAALLSESQLDEIMKKAEDFVSDVNRPVTTKDGWNELFNDD